MRKFIQLLCFLAVASIGQAQSTIDINQVANFIDIDSQGNIFLVNDIELLKYNQEGKLLYRYSNAINGSITSIDVTNPLRILVFYKESNAIIYLNQQLAKITDAIQIDDLSGIEATIVASSSKGGFWAYDALTMTLLFFDNNRIMQKQSVNLAGYLNGEEPLYLVEQLQSIYLQTKNKILVFDIYGNLIKTLPFSSINKIRVVENSLHALDTSGIVNYNLLSKEKTVFSLSDYSNYVNAFLFKTRLVLQTKNGASLINIE